MNWQDGLNALGFYNEMTTHKQIDPISAGEKHVLVMNWNWQLHLKGNSRL